jgi:hypothetical protein
MTPSQIRKRLKRDLPHLIKTCHQGNLAHLAFGQQPLGIVIVRERDDFAVRFLQDQGEGLPDPRDPYGWTDFLLPYLPALASTRRESAYELVSEAMSIAALASHQRERLLHETPTYPQILELLMINPRVTSTIRRRVLDAFKAGFSESDIEDVVDGIHSYMHDDELDPGQGLRPRLR